MFSGIIEAVGEVLKSESAPGIIRIWIERPQDFTDLKIGDSISTNGVCLTVESLAPQTITFTLAAETLAVLGLRPAKALELVGQRFNLERSLRFGDRIHGHLVTGHVDSLGEIIERREEGESLHLTVRTQNSVLPFLWHKGSITINGTSLTVNRLRGNDVTVCLIPETLKRTNLGQVTVGSAVTIEPDYMARAVARAAEIRGSTNETQV